MADDTQEQHNFSFPTQNDAQLNPEPIDQGWAPEGAHKPATEGWRQYDPSQQTREYEFLLRDVLNVGDMQGKVKGYEDIEASFAKIREYEQMADAMHAVSHKGDRNPVQMKVVSDEPDKRHIETYLPPEVKELHKQYSEQGWGGISSDADYDGGQGLPHAFMGAIVEQSMSANPGYSVLEGLTKGVIAALEAKGGEELKREWLPRLNKGDFTGAMVMTEPHFGSNLTGVETTLQLGEDGQSGKMFGYKRYLSSADHDATLGQNGERNIIHMVLARTANKDGYLMGTAKIDGEIRDVLLNNDGFVLQTDGKGDVLKDGAGEPLATETQGRPSLTLALVPRVLLDKDGNYVDAEGNKVDSPDTNNVRAVKLNDKMGLEVQSNTDAAYDGSKSFIVGEVGDGLKNMFVIMNEARLGVGLQGTGIAEIVRQNVERYAAEERKQGPGGHIINYPDIQRIVLGMRAHIDAGRSIAAQVGMEFDKAVKGDPKHYSPEERQEIQNYVDVMTPLVKWGLTEYGDKAVDEGQQAMGGAGYMREWGIAQTRADARISRIYEGANGLLAVALAGTQLTKMPSFLNVVRKDLANVQGEGMEDIIGPLDATLRTFEDATEWMMATGLQAKQGDAVAAQEFQAAAGEYMELMYSVAAGTALAKNAKVALGKLNAEDVSPDDKAFLESKVANATFYAQNVLKHEHAMRFDKMKSNTYQLDLPDLGIRKDEPTQMQKGAKSETIDMIREHDGIGRAAAGRGR